MEFVVYILIGVVIGALAGFFFADNKAVKERTGIIADRDVAKNQIMGLQAQLEQCNNEKNELKVEQKCQLEQQNRQLQENFDRQIADVRLQYDRQLEELRRQHEQQMEKQSELIREQINTASEAILKKRSEELSDNNTLQMDKILGPLRDNLKQMRESVEKSDRAQTTSMERLDASIKENLRQAAIVGERADKLAQALTSENKTQGNFGELRLRTILENMGLEDGLQFEEQVTLKDEEGQIILEEENGKRMIPDVVLHFPDHRDVVIDSKMSLKAFEEYCEADDDAMKADALQRHVLSVRNHVKELAKKNYSKYVDKGNNKLDFVLMYVYSESALQLALANDPSLWKEAYDAGVIISGSQSLYVILRVLEMSWRQTRQAENQEKIMQAANNIVDRVQMFYERFRKVDEQLGKTTEAFGDLKRVTAPSGLSITVAAEKLLKLGAQENPKRKVKISKVVAAVSSSESSVALDDETEE